MVLVMYCLSGPLLNPFSVTLCIWVLPSFFHRLTPCNKERLPSSIKPRSVKCCSDGCPSGGFSHLHTGSLEISQSGPSGSWSSRLPRPFSPDCSVWPGGQLRGLGCSKHLPFKNYKGHCALWNLQAVDFLFFVAFFRSVP